MPPTAPFPPRPSGRALRRRAFTLLEILLVLALIGLLTGVLVVGVNRMLNPGPESPGQAFWHAANAARRYALQHETEVRLSYNKDAGLQAVALDGADLPDVKVPDDAEIVFISGLITPTAATNGTNRIVANLFGSELNAADQPVDHVTFYSDGTTSLFRVEVQAGGAGGAGFSGTSYTIEVDPWTCSPMLGTKANGRSG